MEFGDLKIVLDRRELQVDGTAVLLGTRAFDIARLLVEAQGRLVTKDEIMRRVWPGTIVEENSLQVAVSSLRKALGPRRGAIRTVSGRGYQIVREGPKRAATLHNLPAANTELVGRDGVLRDLAAQLASHRVVTLTGVGGIGKTRLAIETARTLLSDYPDGVWMVELAMLTDPTSVPHAVASALGLDMPDNLATPKRVASLLGSRKLLLLLDNCEHVVDAAAELSHALVRANPNLSILATSREPLRAEGESLYRVGPLQMPADDSSRPECLLGIGAVALFVARAHALDPAFPLDPSCLSAIGAICRRLDGIPLAIELAAAQATTLGVLELARRLDDQFRVLTGGFRTALPRHRTLKATFDWSYDLLSDGERRGLCRLAVLAGRFTLDMAEAALSANGDATPVTIETISGLVAKSLVVPETVDGKVQYHLLETMRAYALERLKESGEFDALARWQANYCLRLLEGTELDWQGTAKANTVGEMANPVGNVRAALDWAFSAAGDRDLGMALAAAAAPLWMRLSMARECVTYLERALAALDAGRRGGERLEMKLRTAYGVALLSTVVTGAEIRKAFGRALELAEHLDDSDYRLRALWGLCTTCFNEGDFVTSRDLARRFYSLAQVSADPSALLSATLVLGGALFVLGDMAGGLELTERSCKATELPADLPSSSRFLYNRRAMAFGLSGCILWHLGLVDQSRHRLEQSISEASTKDHIVTLCVLLANWVCTYALARGDFDEADRHVSMLHDHSSRYHLDFGLEWADCFRAAVAVSRGRLAEGVRGMRDVFARPPKAMDHARYTPLRLIFAEALGEAGEVDEAMAVVDRIEEMADRKGHPVALPELYRVKSGIVLQRGGPTAAAEAEALLRQGLACARHQQSLSYELHLATSLVRLLGRPALAELVEVYSKFSEGFDTIDLRTVRSLIDAGGSMS
jgi:predicted ATPase/DNA-binding winged helix-turn-helix (wHTH) protein